MNQEFWNEHTHPTVFKDATQYSVITYMRKGS